MSLPANISNQLQGLKETSTRMQAESDSDGIYIKMDKTGHWIYGADDLDIEPDSLWAINPSSLMTGFIAWDDGEPAGEEMRPAHEAPLTRAELPDVGAKWTPQVGFQMACTNGEDEGVQVIYKTNSKGGQKAFKQILNAIIKQAESGTDKVVALVELDSDSYKHKEYGKIYTPVFKIVEWATMDGLPAPEEAEPKEVVEPEPEPKKEETTSRNRSSRRSRRN